MSNTTPHGGSAPTRRLRPWRARLVTRRARVQWQLALVVTAIAVLACTLISSLALLVAATELGAVRGALTSATVAETEVRVSLTRPSIALDDARENLESTIAGVLGDSATWTSQALALSELYVLPQQGAPDPLFYLGELDAVESNTSLVAGVWPDGAGEVAIPDAGADVLGLAVGDSLEIFGTKTDQPDRTVTISGIFHITDAEASFWAGDLIGGAGLDPTYPVPGSAGALQTDAIGPLVVPTGTFDADATMVERIVVRVVPDFSATTVEALGPLQERLIAAPDLAPATIGDVADAAEVSTRLPTLISSVTAVMAVTRSIVVVVSLLLFVLAVAALAQAARLLTEARVAERHLMRARGASNRQVLGLAAVEALLIAAVTIAASPFLARGVYLVVAQQPAMAAAGMAGDPGIPPLVWAVAIAVGVLFWVVLVAPMVGREGSFHEGEQGKARPRRFSGLQRSGVDIALLVLAGVAYSQLLVYQGPTSTTQLGVDPILVAGPALVLLAGAFLAVRLIPAAGLLTERIAASARGAVVSLAAWEIGRRAQRATAAILLITLALAVGTFSLSFLTTWRQSQIDQSAFALGAPLRLTSEADVVSVPQSAQPVIRYEGLVNGADANQPFRDTPKGEPIALLGLTADARAMLDRGRLADEGGDIVADAISESEPLAKAIPLPDDTAGIAAVVRITPAAPLDGVIIRLRMLVVDEGGNQSVIDMGTIEPDGEEHEARGAMADGVGHNGLSLVAFQAIAVVRDPMLDGATARTKVDLVMRDITSVGTPDADTPVGAYISHPVEIPSDLGWRAAGEGEDTANYPSAYAPDEWQLGISLTIPMSLASQAASYVGMSWPTVIDVNAVITQSVADAIDAKVADRLTVYVDGVAVGLYVVAITPSVPGGGVDNTIGALGRIGKDADMTVVVDEQQLARALFQRGLADNVVHEWWVDLPAGDSEQYLNYLAVQYDQLAPQSAELLAVQMQQDPLRVATQGALWLVIGGAAALAAVGFAVHATGSLRSRSTEFAQLRAVGLSRRRLVGIIGIESLLLCVLGTLFGIGLGLVLAYLVGPLVGVSGDGSTPVPAVAVQIPAAQIGLLAAILAVVLAVVVLGAARVQRVAEPASALRRGEER